MLSISNLNSGYGKIIAIENMSMEIKEGQTCIVVGPNGSGKSTLLRTITGLLKPVQGSITFQGDRIDGKRPFEIVQMGISMSPEGTKLFPDFTVQENLRIGAYNKTARIRWRETLEEVYSLFPVLSSRKNQRAASLSGGERQMLAIARALMSMPKLILLDEPSCGLAPKIVSQCFQYINSIKEKGNTILLVEQNVRKAIELADYVYLLVAGKLKFGGTPDEFRGIPELEQAFLGQM